MRIGLNNKVLRFIAIVFSLILFPFLFFVYDVRKIKNLPSDFFCEDIVVLTGGKNRIQLALDSIKRFHAKRVFISGVYKSTKLTDILQNKEIGDVSVILGYKAQNTKGNALEVRGMVEDLGIKEIVLVTSDYHMFRSLYEVKKYNKNLKIYPVKVESTFNFRFLSLCFKEFYYSFCILIRDLIKGIVNA